MIKTVYFVPTTHHDLGYTHLIDDLLESVYCNYYDHVLDYCEQTENYPWEAQYRYSVEEFWSLDAYLRKTSEYNRARLKKYIAEGRIELPALYANIIDGICTREELARSMYPSAAFAKECGVTIKTAALTDMPGMSDGTIAALSAAGIRYLFAGFPKYFRWGDVTGAVPAIGHEYWEERAINPWGHPSAFRWKSLTGGEVFVWYQDGYGWFGNDSEAVVPHETIADIERYLPQFLSEIEKRGTPYSVMRYIDHGSDNEMPQNSICEIVRAWNETHSDVRLVVATNAMFFEALEEDCRHLELPLVIGELPHTDYTTLSLTDAPVTAMNHRTKAQVLNLEKAAALIGGIDRSCTHEIYNNILLYDEHCFGMSVPHGSLYEYNRLMKVKHAYRAAFLADQLQNQLMTQCMQDDGWSSFSPVPGNGIAHFLSKTLIPTQRIGEQVILQCDEVILPLLPIPSATEEYGTLLPGQKLWECTVYVPSDAIQSAYYTTESDLETGTPSKLTEGVLENAYYRITYGENGIQSLYDKALDREITDGSLPVGSVLFRDIRANAVHTWKTNRTYRRKSGPVADSIVIEATCDGAPQITAEITLYHTVKRIDFAYRMLIDRTPVREMYIEFPFSVNAPKFSYGGTDCEVNAFDDIITGSNTNQYAANGYAAVSGENEQIVLSFADTNIVTFGGLHPTMVSQAHHFLNPDGFEAPFIGRDDIRNAHIASMIAYNNCRTNFAVSQLGELFCRYSVTSGTQVNADRCADVFIHEPMLMRGRLPAAECKVLPANVRPITLKQSENEDGWILRIKEVEQRDSTVSLYISGKTVTEVWICDLTEHPLESCEPQSIPIQANQTLTLYIKIKEI